MGRRLAAALAVASLPLVIQCAHGQPSELEQPTAPPRLFRDCPDCPIMVQIPGGTFRQGLTDWHSNGSVQPARTVTIRPFAIGFRETTKDEYAAFEAATSRPSRWCSPRARDNGAARCLTWYDAQAYVEWLTARTGRYYRLPSESEWEYVARGASLEGVSRFGVRDLFTQAREWMADCHSPNYQGAPTDGSPWVGDPGCLPRVVRGGGWHELWPALSGRTMTDRRKLRSLERHAARRTWMMAGRTATTMGMRVVREREAPWSE